ncbi:hypothetical protein ColTof4_07205 [Colletotrichum tofieldiae]|nr:hypothetical protein ColTof3_12146 [Colletotrichum tofieldiae]GKT74782.1 hypothetical protein ColTof4_07205 [Colletotrichum tofieldiae]GKT91977.1 hypothetical protein Ct61P_09827 [Colletotrichum tofieldiae]
MKRKYVILDDDNDGSDKKSQHHEEDSDLNEQSHSRNRTSSGRRSDESEGDARWDGFPEFIKSTDDNLYWITGKPGSGKSTLLRFLADDIRTQELLATTSYAVSSSSNATIDITTGASNIFSGIIGLFEIGGMRFGFRIKRQE